MADQWPLWKINRCLKDQTYGPKGFRPGLPAVVQRYGVSSSAMESLLVRVARRLDSFRSQGAVELKHFAAKLS